MCLMSFFQLKIKKMFIGSKYKNHKPNIESTEIDCKIQNYKTTKNISKRQLINLLRRT